MSLPASPASALPLSDRSISNQPVNLPSRLKRLSACRSKTSFAIFLYPEAEINYCLDFAASRLRVKPDQTELVSPIDLVGFIHADILHSDGVYGIAKMHCLCQGPLVDVSASSVSRRTADMDLVMKPL